MEDTWIKPIFDCGNVRPGFSLALVSEFVTEQSPVSGLSVGDSAESQERQDPTAGWDNLLQVGAQCLQALLFHE